MAKAKPKDKTDNLIAQNRRAKFDYSVVDTYEGGLVLTGSEVKALRAGNGNIGEAYAVFKGDELFLLNAHIAKYDNGGYANHEERRTRKILLHRKELDYLKKEIGTQGVALIPLKLYWQNGKAKVLVGLATGKKNVDKRQTIKERDWNRQQHRILKQKI